MSGRRLHEDEVAVDTELVRALVATQATQWAGLPLSAFGSAGTVNAIFRLGPDMYVRLPRAARFVTSLDNEFTWLPHLAPNLSLAVPEPLMRGEPGAGFPFPWAIFHWLEGTTYSPERVVDEVEEGRRLGRFVLELRAVDHAGAPRSTRDAAVTDDVFTKYSIERLPARFDQEAVRPAWDAALEAAPWHGAGATWTHGDLIPPNVLVRDGRIAGVLDFGEAGVGDPAVDLIPAWALFGHEGRAAFRATIGADDDTWHRARAFAYRQAIRIIPYYLHTHPDFVAMASATVARVLDDLP